MSPVEPLIAGVTVAVGACLQGAVGFGLGLLAVPILVLVDPMLVPVPLIVASLALNLGASYRNRDRGAPIALLYQRAHGAALRGTLALYFLVGSVLSLVVLALFGRLGGHELLESAQLAPFMVAGFACSGRAGRVLDRGRTSPGPGRSGPSWRRAKTVWPSAR